MPPPDEGGKPRCWSGGVMAKKDGASRASAKNGAKLKRRREQRKDAGLEEVRIWVPQGRRAYFQDLAAREVEALNRARSSGFERMVLLVPTALVPEIAATGEGWRRKAEEAGAVGPGEAVV